MLRSRRLLGPSCERKYASFCRSDRVLHGVGMVPSVPAGVEPKIHEANREAHQLSIRDGKFG